LDWDEREPESLKKFRFFTALQRKIIQLAAFGFTNSHLGNFAAGKLYTGKFKNFCAPGLNCYSCPAAGLACPIGSLQTVLGTKGKHVSLYVTGIILAFGVIFGRFICGFLCPFGLLQELLHKIPMPRPKGKLPAWTKYVKYVLLVAFVIIWPLATSGSGAGEPGFCQYICPAGTLEAGIPLILTHPELQGVIGWLFSWKMIVLVLVLVGSLVHYRFFCKVLCPLGAIYGMLNKVSLMQVHIDRDACISCGKCARVCKMDVDICKNPTSAECIRCGECVHACPVNAIRIGFGEKKAQQPVKE